MSYGGEMNLSSLIDRKGGFIPKIEVKDMYTICLYKTM